MKNRASLPDHLEWTRSRALAYLDEGRLDLALASCTSDLNKGPPIADSLRRLWTREGLAFVMIGDAQGLRDLIMQVTTAPQPVH